jgi:23S rRNA (cytosine1962-C5)-methyltransferase
MSATTGQPTPLLSYQLVDSGEGRKLERIGPYILDRQAPQAIWPKRGDKSLWASAHGVHHRSDDGGGHWKFQKAVPDEWTVSWESLQLSIRPTPFGHIGIFPEHGAPARTLADRIQRRVESGRPVSVLNLFAYTGASTLTFARAGASCVHVDAAHGVVAWARENAALSGLADRPIRWIVDDCREFVEREAKRGRTFHGILLDPPTYGRGQKKQVWDIATDLTPLLQLLKKVLDPDPLFCLLSAHTPGYSPLTLANLLTDVLAPSPKELRSFEMSVDDERGRALPSGAAALALW